MSRRHLAEMTALACLVLCAGSLSGAGPAAAASPGSSRHAPTGGIWGDAIEVPGTAAPNTGRDADVDAVSCSAPGNCVVGGSYADRASQTHGFVDAEVNGTLRLARSVPGLAAFGAGSSQISAISCGGPGNCVAVGWTYIRKSFVPSVAFAVSYSHGSWHRAVAIRGSIVIGGPSSGDLSISCPSAGNCVVGGSYFDRSDHPQAFAAHEVRGIWRKAIEVPGTASLNRGGSAQVNSVSCASPGNCAVAGSYLDRARVTRAFVDDLVRGSWRRAREVPGTKSSRLGADLTAVSCASRGNCSAGGYIGSVFHETQALVVREVNGTWRPAIVVPGTIALNRLRFASVATVSCASPGNCSAGGSYYAKPFTFHAFVVNEVSRIWRKAIEVPGTAALNVPGGTATVSSVSCASPGSCSAGGTYQNPSDDTQAFVVTEANGIWGKAIEVPGITALGTQAEILSLSCARPGKCTAGGDFFKSGVVGIQAMVVNEH